MIKFVNGDITKSSTGIIAHQVNCRGLMGAGVAKSIKAAFPNVYPPYKALCTKLGSKMLGGIQAITVPSGQVVINCFGQDGYGTQEQHTNYVALHTALVHLKEYATGSDFKSISIPYRIGCGLGGGDWKVVYNMILSIFRDYAGELLIYKL